jgi:hypothetical protein
LKHQRYKIAGDEDPGVVSSLNFASFLSERENEVFQCEIDACRDEGGREDEARDFDFEAE